MSGVEIEIVVPFGLVAPSDVSGRVCAGVQNAVNLGATVMSVIMARWDGWGAGEGKVKGGLAEGEEKQREGWRGGGRGSKLWTYRLAIYTLSELRELVEVAVSNALGSRTCLVDASDAPSSRASRPTKPLDRNVLDGEVLLAY